MLTLETGEKVEAEIHFLPPATVSHYGGTLCHFVDIKVDWTSSSFFSGEKRYTCRVVEDAFGKEDCI